VRVEFGHCPAALLNSARIALSRCGIVGARDGAYNVRVRKPAIRYMQPNKNEIKRYNLQYANGILSPQLLLDIDLIIEITVNHSHKQICECYLRHFSLVHQSPFARWHSAPARWLV
jgi:hypothetical protein